MVNTTEIQSVNDEPVSDKKYYLILLFSIFLGYVGADRFYRGDIKLGILKLITLGGLGVWYLVDLILVLFGKMRDRQGRKFEGTDVFMKPAQLFIAVYLGLQLLSPFLVMFISYVIAPIIFPDSAGH